MSGILQSVKGFVQRHKWKLGITASLGAAAYVAGKVVDWQLAERADKEAAELIEQARRLVKFESIQQAGTTTVQAVLPEVSKELGEHASANDILKDLKKATSIASQTAKNPAAPAELRKEHEDTKVALWNELKVAVFTEMLASVYTLALLTTFVRVQLNILGGYFYARDSQLEGKEAADDQGSPTGRLYLDQAKVLKTHGIGVLVEKLRPVVQEVLAAYPVETTLQFSQEMLTKRLFDAMAKVEDCGGRDGSIFTELTFNKDAANTTAGAASLEFEGSIPTFEHLMNETRDIVDSRPFAETLRKCAATCLQHIDDSLAAKLFTGETTNVEMAKLIPKLHNETKKIFNPMKGPIDMLLVHQDVQDFSCRIFESFCEANRTTDE